MNTLTRLFPNSKQLYITLFLFSLLLSALMNYHAVPNTDGILYLRAAEVFTEEGFHQALTLFPWPFYSILIGLFHQITGLEFQTSATLINSVLFAGTLVLFVNLVKKLGGSLSVQILAALIIILLPPLCDYRDYIIRDLGYWPFMLLGFRAFLNYSEQRKLSDAITMGLFFSIATLFRVEGVVILLLTPCLMLCQSRDVRWCTRIRTLLPCYTVPLVLAILWALVLLATNNMNLLGRLPEIIDAFAGIATLPLDWAIKQEQLLSILPIHAKNDEALLILLGGFGAYFFYEILRGLSLMGALLFVYTLVTRSLPNTGPIRLTIGFAFINLGIALIFLAQDFFLSQRYLMPAILILLLATPFGLAHFLTQLPRWTQMTQRTIKIALVVIVLYLAVDATTSFGPSPYYLRQAGEWLALHPTPQTRLLANHDVIYYYARANESNWQKLLPEDGFLWQIRSIDKLNYDYVAIRITHKEPQLNTFIQEYPPGKLVAEFSNNREDKVLIFKTLD